MRRLSTMVRAGLIVGAVAALAACTPMRWEHPQLGVAAADEDVRDCSIKARQEAWRYSFMYQSWSYPRPYAYRDRAGRVHYADPVFPRYRDPTFDEWNLRDYCMRSKGYKLVPVPENERPDA
jgi:hypothetical protein